MERKPFTGPNLNAPRNRKQIKDFLSYPDKDPYGFFSRLKQQYPQLEKYSNKEIAGWIMAYNEGMAAEVTTNSWNGVKLPQDLGYVIVGVHDVPEGTARKNINFGASKKLGVIVRHVNMHSNDRVAKIHYYNDIPWHRFKNNRHWKFKPCRKLQRAVASDFREGNCRRYKPFSKWCKVGHLYRKNKKLAI